MYIYIYIYICIYMHVYTYTYTYIYNNNNTVYSPQVANIQIKWSFCSFQLGHYNFKPIV